MLIIWTEHDAAYRKNYFIKFHENELQKPSSCKFHLKWEEKKSIKDPAAFIQRERETWNEMNKKRTTKTTLMWRKRGAKFLSCNKYRFLYS